MQILLTLLLTVAVPAVAQRASVPPEAIAKPGWALTWSDEFDAPDGSAVDPAKWSYDVGGNGWGNQELEYYTSSTRNAEQRGGMLVITAKRERMNGAEGVTREYTSARLKTKEHFAQAYGRFEARIKVPRGQGLWPAFWLLGNDIDKIGWPKSGEIDIMENIGKEPDSVHGTIHGPGYSGAGGIGSPYSLIDHDFADSFHVYAIEWEPNEIRFYVDDELYATRRPSDLPHGTKWVYDHPFFIILDLAVGGAWPGNPDATTRFPQAMLVDYVRVYKREDKKTSGASSRVSSAAFALSRSRLAPAAP